MTSWHIKRNASSATRDAAPACLPGLPTCPRAPPPPMQVCICLTCMSNNKLFGQDSTSITPATRPSTSACLTSMSNNELMFGHDSTSIRPATRPSISAQHAWLLSLRSVSISCACCIRILVVRSLQHVLLSRLLGLQRRLPLAPVEQRLQHVQAVVFSASEG